MKNRNNFQFNQKGFGLIEAVVGIIVALGIILAFTALISRAVAYSSINGKQLKATLYLQEMVEAAKDLEQFTTTWQSNWVSATGDECNTTTPAVCYTAASGTSWVLISTTPAAKGETVENTYNRWLTIENVCRSTTTNEILLSPCDPGDPEYSSTTKKIIAEIEWNDKLGSQHLEMEAYLYNYNP